MDTHAFIQNGGHLAWLLLWLGFSTFTGAAVLAALGRLDTSRALCLPSPELKLFVSICAGIALQFPVLIVLGLAGALTPVFIGGAAALMLAGTIILRRCLASCWPTVQSPDKDRIIYWLETLPLWLLITAWVFRPLGPSSSHDDISYHLPYARFYLEQGGLAVNEFLRYPLHTHNYNLLYAVALLREGTTMGQLVHAASGWLVMLGTWGLARHWYGWLTAVVATALLLLLQRFYDAFGNAYADLGLVLFFTASVAALALWYQDRRNAWLWLSAIFAGTMAGIKYYALVIGGLWGLVVVSLTRRPKRVLVFVGITSLIGCFWYVRSYLISGNPVHPFASDIFGYYVWTAADVSGQWYDLGRHGVEKTISNFALLPWHLVSNPKAFHGDPGLVGWLVGFFILSFGVFRHWTGFMKALSLLALAYLVFWFATSQVVRYLIPVTPVFALCVASTVGMLVKQVQQSLTGRGKPVYSISLRVGAMFGKLLVIFPVAVFWWGTLSKDIDRVPINAQDQASFLSKQRGGYELFNVARAHPMVGSGPLLQLRFEADRFYFDGVLYGDWFGHHPYRRLIEHNEEGKPRLRDAGFFWHYLRENEIRGLVLPKNYEAWYYPEDLASFKPWFDIVFSNDHGDLLVPRDTVPVEPGSDTTDYP